MRRRATPRNAMFISILGYGLLGGAARAEPPAPDVVAVFNIQARDVPGFTPADADTFTDYLISELTVSGMSVVSRAQVRARLIQQQAESYEACYAESCQIELGKAVAAQKVISSTWARLGSTGCTLTATIYDLRSEATEFSAKADAECDGSGLRTAIEQVGTALRSRAGQGYGKFKLDLEDGRAIKNPPTDEHGYLSIKAEAKARPSERIEAYVNGELAGLLVNGLFMKELPVGSYIVVLRTPGNLFAHQRFEVTMSKDGVRIPKEGFVQLQPVFGTLVIGGTPSEATAVIDGEPRPIHGGLREERRMGTYNVEIESPGYLPQPAQNVRVEPGGEVLFKYSLDRNAGSIAVAGAPAGATVLIDGNAVGTVPLTVPEIDVGDHIVEVQAPGHRLERRLVAVKRGERTNVEANLGEKRARLKIEAVARVIGEETPVEADVLIDGTKVGSTPWKGEVLAEVPLEVRLRLGREETGVRRVGVQEGGEQREVIEVPASWGGASSTLRFDLVPGPWEVRSGGTVMSVAGPSAVRPGEIPVDFFLDGKKVGHANVVVSPNENRVISIGERPRTDAELASSRKAWTWRRWLSLGGAVIAGAVGTERMLAAHRAASDRDAAISALAAADTAEDLAAYRSQVIDDEHARASAQIIGLGALGAAIGLALWSTYEWFDGEPDPARLGYASREVQTE